MTNGERVAAVQATGILIGIALAVLALIFQSTATALVAIWCALSFGQK